MNCPICNKELQLTDTYCPECGFEMHIYPKPISSELKNYEEERVNKYKEQKIQKEKELKKQKEDYGKVSSQLSKACDTLKEQEEKLKTAEAKRKTDRQEIDRLNDELEKERKSNYTVGIEHSKQISELQRQLTTTIHEREKVKRQLNDEQNAHIRTKQQVKQLKEDIERISANGSQHEQPTETKSTPQTSINNIIIGKVSFSSGGRTEAIDLFKGLCGVTAPSWTNISGKLFEIDGDNGIYRLRDLKGIMCDRHGKSVSPQGVTTRNNDIFTIGSLTIKFSLPEIDFENLY